jgi:glutaredoxin
MFKVICILRVLAFSFTALFSSTAMCEIYKWTDSAGKTHFSDQKPDNAKTEKVHVQNNSYTHVTYQLPPSPPEPTAKTNKNVVMYSTAWYGYCKKARAYFESHNIASTDYDIEHSDEAKQNYDAIGGHGVPIIFIGPACMNGFSSESFEYLYRQ